MAKKHQMYYRYNNMEGYVNRLVLKLREKLGEEPYRMTSKIPPQIRLLPKVARDAPCSPLFVAAVEEYLSIDWFALSTDRPIYEEEEREEIKIPARRFFNKYAVNAFESFDPVALYADVKIWNEFIDLSSSEYMNLMLSFLREIAIPYSLWHLHHAGFRNDILQTLLAMDLLSKYSFGDDTFIFGMIRSFRSYKKSLTNFLEEYGIQVEKYVPSEDQPLAGEWLENHTELLAEDWDRWSRSRESSELYFLKESELIRRLVDEVGGSIELERALERQTK